MSSLAITIALAAVVASAGAPPASPAKALAQQRDLLRAIAAAGLVASPEERTATGDFSQAGELDDRSLRAASRLAERNRGFAWRLARIPTVGFPEEARLDHDVMLYELQRRLREHALKLDELPVSEKTAAFLDLSGLPDAFPLNTAARYRAYVARLREVPRVLSDERAAMRQGLRDGLRPVRSQIASLPARCEEIASRNPFIGPADAPPSDAAPAERTQLAADLRRTVRQRVLPAYHAFCAYLSTTYLSQARTDPSLASLRDGAQLYADRIARETTTSLSAAQIYDTGLREVARLEAELEARARSAGYRDLRAWRAALAADPRFRPTSARQVTDDFRRYEALIEPRLGELVSDPPLTQLVIEPMPPGAMPNITHHVDGSVEAKVPGRILVATSDLARRSLIGDETIAFHEGLPGHELQVSIAQRHTRSAPFRRGLRYSAYAEGWAVYAEHLGEELGLFKDPAAEYGRLNTELTRALRLVADTGMHAQGWSRDRVVAYLRESGAEDEPTLQAEADRIAAWPAQGLSYKIGQLALLNLRDRARRELGSAFDLRAFHDALLDAGPLPLPVLEARVDRWIAARRPPA